ncbi:EscU/YscU/HrcU family type III secretion system export apparatus switch protein [Acidisoma sp. C75]
MAEGDSGERKHAPTERRLRQAAEQGNLARSLDLQRAAAMVMAILVGLKLALMIGETLQAALVQALAGAGSGKLNLAGLLATDLMRHLLPLMLMIAAISLLAGLAVGGWVLSLAALVPQLGKLVSLAGLGEIFSASGYSEIGKSLLKLCVIGGAAALSISAEQDSFPALLAAPQAAGFGIVALCLVVLRNVAVAIGLIAAADIALQIWLHRHKLRMSDQELRDEMKDVVGNPHVKQRQKAIARKMARSRQMRRIPEASVVVTNPTHFAVALRFRRGVDAAPKLLAKGTELMALEIIAKARAHGIPIIEAPPLARAIYRFVEPDDYIPVALYKACAEVLAYIWRLQSWRMHGGGAAKPAMPKLSEIDMGRPF